MAVNEWHKFMANPGTAASAPPSAPMVPAPAPSSCPTVQELTTLFLNDAESRLKASTLIQYRVDLALFARTFGKCQISALNPSDVSRWLHRMKVRETTKSIRIRSVSACFGWAVKTGILTESPIKRVPKPRTRSRGEETVIEDEDHAKLMAGAKPAFQLVLRVLRDTGCRPGEACQIAVENFDAERQIVRLEQHKSDRHGKPRLIFVPADLCVTLSALAARYGAGPLLRTKRGNAWSGRSITQRMQKLKLKTGIKAMAYGYRHGFATDALKNGLPDAQVAALLGHSSTAMLHKHYSHLTAQAGVLRDALSKVRA